MYSEYKILGCRDPRCKHENPGRLNEMKMIGYELKMMKNELKTYVNELKIMKYELKIIKKF